MRRKDKEITDVKEIESIIAGAKVMHCGMVDEKSRPYVVPLNYAYVDGKFFFHCAKEGRKLEIIKKNPEVFIELCSEYEIVCVEGPNPNPCKSHTKYLSVMASGTARIVEDSDEKMRIVKSILCHYGEGEFDGMKPSSVNAVKIVEITVGRMTGKKSGM